MKKSIRLAQAQVNSVVGDLSYNAEKISSYIRRAESAGASLVTFPELAVTGYPPEDLLFKAHFIQRNMDALKSVTKSVNNIIAVVGFVDKKGSDIYNAAAIIHKKKILAIYHKMLLPNYGVFDEMRYFKSGEKPSVFNINGMRFGVNICEDAWHIKGPMTKQADGGAKIILTINSSPYHIGKIKERERIIQKNARDNRVFVSYTNMVGGQDELVFDGRSMLVDRSGRVIARAKAFEEDLLISDIDLDPAKAGKRSVQVSMPGRVSPLLKKTEEVYQALLLGLKDYVDKNGFKKVSILRLLLS
jgi:NAD+ synthase (glutamine-hydrolysing)